MFVVAVAGVCLGVPLLIVGVGVPILAGTLSWCLQRMDEDSRRWSRWGRGAAAAPAAADPDAACADGWGTEPSPWRRWLGTLGRLRGYRAIFYNIAQLPLSVALFCVSLAVPATVFALMLAPAAYKVASYLYGYELFRDDAVFDLLLPPLTAFQRSLVVGGIGFALFLFLPALLRVCGRLYEGWTIYAACEAASAPVGEAPARGESGLFPPHEPEAERSVAPLH